eukprot:jgi/Botrbrau1/8902/Bobra.0148s0018.2
MWWSLFLPAARHQPCTLCTAPFAFGVLTPIQSTWVDETAQASPSLQAHGGGVLFHEGVFYWYGENKSGPTYTPFGLGGYNPPRVDIIGVSCYSSTDLSSWRSEGLVLKAGVHEDLNPRNVLERPKVLYNNQSGLFVMWMHVDTSDYDLARVGVATSARPTGPFTYLRSFRPHGQQSRDLTVFKDDDGTGYIVYSSENNKVMHIGRLTPDYLDVDSDYVRALKEMSREAPAIFKYKQWYLMFTSGCTGWEPNRPEVYYATEMMGEWKSLGSPCIGGTEMERAFTFFSQDTFVLPVPGLPGRYIYMGDQWETENLGSSRYIWLPMWVVETPSGAPPKPLALSGSAVQQTHYLKRFGIDISRASLKPPPVDVLLRWFTRWHMADLHLAPRSRWAPMDAR